MPIEVPQSITELKDIINLTNDLEFELAIDKTQSPLTEVFNVVILSGEPQKSANLSTATAYGNPVNNPSGNTAGFYYFARVRRLDVDTKEKPDPFLAKTFRAFKRLVAMHPLGVVLESNTSPRPNQGEVWSARYLNKSRRGLLLIKKETSSQEYEKKLRDGNSESWLQDVMKKNEAGRTLENWKVQPPPPGVPQVPSDGTQTPQSRPYNPGAGNYTEDWWIITLESIIALDSMKKGSKKCHWGKRYDEVCPVDGRGIIGIAHWTQGSLNPLVDEIVSALGEAQIVSWFGRSSAELKSFNKTCTSREGKNPCFDNSPWWKSGWNSFVSHPQTAQIQQIAWKKRYAIPSEQTLAEFGWEKTNRNLAILAGIRNSAGRGGVNWHSKKGKRNPEETLVGYVYDAGFSRHRQKRADAINKVFPN